MREICEGKRLLLLDQDGWEYAERKKGKTAVAVIARTADDRVVLTEQLRRPVNARVIDWPAGLVGDDDPNATPETTAKKELEEETGYTCDSVEFLAGGPSSPGITSEIVSLYRAVGARRVGTGGGVEGEEIEVHAIPVSGLVDWLKKQNGAGKLVDLKVWAGLYFINFAT